MRPQVRDVFRPTCGEVVEHDDAMSCGEEDLCQVRPDEPGPAGDEDALLA